MFFLQSHETAALVGFSTFASRFACFFTSKGRNPSSSRRAIKDRNNLTGDRISKRPVAPRVDQTHLQHRAIFGGVARRTEKEVEKISRHPAKALFLAGRPSPPSVVGRNGPVPERHAYPANHRGDWGCRSIATRTLHDTRSRSRPSSCPVHHRARRPLRWCPTTMRSIFSSSANRGI